MCVITNVSINKLYYTMCSCLYNTSVESNTVAGALF